MAKNLLEQTLDLYSGLSDEVSLMDIHRATGVKHSWLGMFVNRDIKEPGVIKVQKVHDFLKRESLRKKRKANKEA